MVIIYRVVAHKNYSILQCFSMGIKNWHQFPGHFPIEGQPWESKSIRLLLNGQHNLKNYEFTRVWFLVPVVRGIKSKYQTAGQILCEN